MGVRENKGVVKNVYFAIKRVEKRESGFFSYDDWLVGVWLERLGFMEGRMMTN